MTVKTKITKKTKTFKTYKSSCFFRFWNNINDGVVGATAIQTYQISSHLVVVDAAVFGHSTLTVHQEAVPPPLLRQSVLVALSDVVIQLTLLITDGLHILGAKRKHMKQKHGGQS